MAPLILRVRPSLAPVLRPARIARPSFVSMRSRYSTVPTTPGPAKPAATTTEKTTPTTPGPATPGPATSAAPLTTPTATTTQTTTTTTPAPTTASADFVKSSASTADIAAEIVDKVSNTSETVKTTTTDATEAAKATKATAESGAHKIAEGLKSATAHASETIKETIMTAENEAAKFATNVAPSEVSKAAETVKAKAASAAETAEIVKETTASAVNEATKTATNTASTAAADVAKSAAKTAAKSAATPSTPPPPPPPAPAPAASRGGSSSGGSGIRTAAYATALGATLFAVFLYGTDTRASVHRWIVPPLIRTLYPDAEDAHHIGTEALKVLYRLGLNPKDRTDDIRTNILEGKAFEYPLCNPIGISAGLDKDADIPDALFDLGAAVVEVGGCTPRPQAGNPRPRVFRVPSVEGLVNRYGLNSIGADALASRLRTRLRSFARAHGFTEADVLSGKAGVPVGSLKEGKILAVQMAKNKDTDEHDVAAVAQDYVYCVRRLAPYADILVVNVSSPNTPGLRDLQAVEPLTKILAAVVDEAKKTAAPSSSAAAHTAAVESGLQTLRARAPRVMVKVSPDEDEDAQIDGIVEAVFASGVDGIIVGNTTKRRDGLVPEKLRLRSNEQANLHETGGFSGPAMYDRTLALVGRYRQRLDEQTQSLPVDTERKTLFASGGVTNGDQALKLLNAGASVAMLYTGLVYGGAGTVTRIKEQMRLQIGEPAAKALAAATPVIETKETKA
ncbi:Dihydroorotate dehydrogenase (quinone), mitochondrial [Sporothrix stenoceras]|uniref:Dihydroorotate dehydrogenase (Quinone), mitochondrial n=1 Tax=Sporothrix stenoceras TaxID=5173 RepID=A0ABR3YGJ2_9PEZI